MGRYQSRGDMISSSISMSTIIAMRCVQCLCIAAEASQIRRSGQGSLSGYLLTLLYAPQSSSTLTRRRFISQDCIRQVKVLHRHSASYQGIVQIMVTSEHLSPSVQQSVLDLVPVLQPLMQQ